MLYTYEGIEEGLRKISEGLKGITGTTHNAILQVPKGDGAVIIDEETGNYILEDINVVSVKAKLIQKKDPFITINSGVDTLRTYLEGWLIEPYSYDGYLPNYLTIELLQNNVWATGKFTFIDAIPTNLNEAFKINIATGQKIKGYFEISEQGI